MNNGECQKAAHVSAALAGANALLNWNSIWSALRRREIWGASILFAVILPLVFQLMEPEGEAWKAFRCPAVDAIPDAPERPSLPCMLMAWGAEFLTGDRFKSLAIGVFAMVFALVLAITRSLNFTRSFASYDSFENSGQTISHAATVMLNEIKREHSNDSLRGWVRNYFAAAKIANVPAHNADVPTLMTLVENLEPPDGADRQAFTFLAETAKMARPISRLACASLLAFGMMLIYGPYIERVGNYLINLFLT